LIEHGLTSAPTQYRYTADRCRRHWWRWWIWWKTFKSRRKEIAWLSVVQSIVIQVVLKYLLVNYATRRSND